jgi:hypothetical protein
MSNSSFATLQCGRRPPMLPRIEDMLGHLKGGRVRSDVRTFQHRCAGLVRSSRNGENHIARLRCYIEAIWRDQAHSLQRIEAVMASL